jgi:hypothetical protein
VPLPKFVVHSKIGHSSTGSGEELGLAVGRAVGTETGESDGKDVGEGDGTATGLRVGSAIGDSEGTEVGPAVGAGHNPEVGQHDPSPNPTPMHSPTNELKHTGSKQQASTQVVMLREITSCPFRVHESPSSQGYSTVKLLVTRPA